MIFVILIFLNDWKILIIMCNTPFAYIENH